MQHFELRTTPQLRGIEHFKRECKRTKMTINDIHKLAIKIGIKADLRGEKTVKKHLKMVNDSYKRLRKEEKDEFDKERLNNPYPDTRILFDSKIKNIKKILAGIDIGVEELLLADKLGGIDLVISHHPRGVGLANLESVMELQVDIMNKYGVPIHIAESLIKKRISEVSRGVSKVNHNKAVDAAKLLNAGFMCVHTAADNLVADFVDKKLKKDKPELVRDILKSLKEIPEYKEAIKFNAGPRLFTGSKNNRAGEIALTEITGGTEGSPEIYKELSNRGIGTIVGMHISETHREKAKKAHINVVIAGHMASDSLGMNLFLDELERKGIEIIPCSGLIRVKRFK